MTSLPSGTVTFLFTDIEGSTKLAQQYPHKWEALRERHHSILRRAIEANRGYVFQIIGDAFCAAFHTAWDGLNAALDAQRKLQNEDWGDTAIKVRMGLHTGSADLHENDYRGYLTMAKVQRVMSVAYGGQVLLSNASAELLRGELPEGIALRNMNENRLKGFLNPERLWQLVASDLLKDFPPLQTLNAIPTNLPIQLTSFIGREKEISEVKQSLSATRLLTLTGSGGTGKTRLSLQVAMEVMDAFKDGVWFTELAPLTDSALIPQAVASEIGLREEQGRSIIKVLSDYLSPKTTLIILDNCEHLIEGCARFADTILRAAPNVKILTSSREALNISGEATYRVPSLAVPDPQHGVSVELLTQYDAVQLFIERARAVMPTFEVNNANAPAVAQICYHLDGIPLAIELAAARVRGIKVEQIVQYLDNRFLFLTGAVRTALPRHQTLRAMIDWSHSLLSDRERILFRRLSVFAGGWTIEAAEVVCAGDGIESLEILDLLLHLVDKSLIFLDEQSVETRYGMLETIREYAHNILVEYNEETQVHQRHAEFYAQWAERATSQIYSPMQAVWLKRLDVEQDNLRAVLGWAVNFNPVLILKIANALADYYWYLRGTYAEGIQWYERALPSTPDAPIELRAYAMTYIAHFALQQGQTTQYAEEGLNLARQSDDKILLAQALDVLGATKLEGGDPQGAAVCFEEALPLALATQSPRILPVTFEYLGWVRVGTGDYNQAEAYFQQAANAYRASYLLNGLTESLWNLGDLAFLRGDIAKARADLNEGLSLALELQNKTWIAHISETLGRIHILDGVLDDARSLLHQSLGMHQDLGRRSCISHNLEGWARLALVQGNPQRAASLLGALTAHLNRLGMSLIPLQKLLFDQTLLAIQQQLDNATFQSAWSAGEKMNVEQAIAFALEETEGSGIITP